MGDVYDAMKRAQKKRGPDAPRNISQDGGDDVAPALQYDDVAEAAAARGQESADLPVEQVADAVTQGSGRVQAPRDDAAPPLVTRLPTSDPKLNGYAAEIVVHHDRGSAITEQYRSIRTQILARCRNRRLQTHVLTSSTPEEGKSVTTVNLGIAFSELKDQKILLLEGDLRRPAFSKLFDRKGAPGLIQLLRGELDDVEQALQPTVYANLQFMPAGGRDLVSSTELLSSPRMADLLKELRSRYDHIFVDTPPIVTVTDPAILGALCDQTLLVVRLNKTPVEYADRAKRLLRAANCELGGVILTHLQHYVPKYLYSYYRYA